MSQKIEQQPLEPATSEGFAEAEYEEAVASLEPEHPERRILDRFCDKLAEGDLAGAAKELWALDDAGGSLCRSHIEFVADLLDGSATGTVFPYGLGFRKRGRGRPKSVLQSHLQAPWSAFASGDELKTSEALRELDALGGTDLETLARLLSGDPTLPAYFPWRLVPQKQNPKRGRPRTMRTQARQGTRAIAAAEARSRYKHAKPAIWELCERTKLSRATVYKAEKAMRDKSRIN
jgi:hypothetical protein